MEKPDYYLYKDCTTGGSCPKAPPEDLDPTPDAAPDHYLDASVLLPQGGKFSRVNLICCKHYYEGNTIGRANSKLFLDHMWYEVEFVDDKITNITANVIVGSMYEQVDLGGNDTFMVDCMVYYKRN